MMHPAGQVERPTPKGPPEPQVISEAPPPPMQKVDAEDNASLTSETMEAIAAIDTLDPLDPHAELALLAAATSEEIDPDLMYDYLLSLGARGSPALGALAARIQEEDSDKAQYIVDQLMDSIQPGKDESETMLTAEALLHARSADIPDRIYTMIEGEADDKIRFKLYGALTGKPLSAELKEKFKALALNDPSEDIKAIGRQWEKLIDGKP